MAERHSRAHRRRVARVLIGATIAVLALGASPALADTGAVYFDGRLNAAAGDPNNLFNATFTGDGNVGLGASVMPNLTDGMSNVATGAQALNANTSGDNNTATGTAALLFNTSGDFNVATGASSLLSNSSGSNNLAAGFGALNANTTGDGNVATGYSALHSSRTGARNVAAGIKALDANTTGKINVAAGRLALSANTTGNANVAIGANAGKKLTTGSNNIDIANVGKAGEAGTIRIGNNDRQTATFIGGISGTSLSGAAQPVVVSQNGKLGTANVSAGASAKSTVSARKFSRLQAQVKALRHEVSQLRARGR
jgi:hypothetical protein